MKAQLTPPLLAALLAVVFTVELNAQTTEFTYQGQLAENGMPANGVYDLTFELWQPKGSVGVVTNTATVVSNGLFTVLLDFGRSPFSGTDLWLEIGVVTNGGATFVTLSPRQPLTSAPYAIQAATASVAELVSGDISANQLTSGHVPADRLSGTYPNELTLNNVFNTFNGDGSGLSGIHSLDAADGSPTDAVYVDSEGSVGIGTTTPATALHVVGTLTASTIASPMYGGSNQTTLFLQTAASGVPRSISLPDASGPLVVWAASEAAPEITEPNVTGLSLLVLTDMEENPTDLQGGVDGQVVVLVGGENPTNRVARLYDNDHSSGTTFHLNNNSPWDTEPGWTLTLVHYQGSWYETARSEN